MKLGMMLTRDGRGSGIGESEEDKLLEDGYRERIGECVLLWFGHVERMENDRITKRVHVGECAGIQSFGRPQKRWIDTVKDCLRK